LGPLPKAVELPMSDVGTPSIGEGGGIVPASWDRGHGGLQVQAQENSCTRGCCQQNGGETAQTSPRQAGTPHTDMGRGPMPHRSSGRGEVSHRVQAQGTDTQRERGPKSQQKSWGQP
jgi:hypothetical protein